MFGDRPQDRPKVEREFDRPLNPKERAAVRKAVKIASSGAARRNTKEAARQALAAKIRSGEYISPADLKQAQAAGVSFGPRGIVGKTFKGFAEQAEYALPGLYQGAKAGYGDVHSTLSGKPTIKRSYAIGKAVGKGFVESAEHPLRHPDQTILNALAVGSLGAGAAARLGAAGTAAREVGVGAAARAALRKPKPPIRKVKVGDTEFQGTYSKNAARRAAQRAMDKRAVKRAAQGKPEALNAQAGRFGARQRMIEEDAARSPEMTVRSAGRKLTPGQQMAVRAVVEQTPLEHRLALAKQELARATKPRDKARLKREVGLIQAAKPYVRTAEDGKVEIADFAAPRKASKRKAANPAQLRAQVDRIVKGGKRREAQGQELNLLTPETIEGRRNRPAEIAREAAHPTPEGTRARLAELDSQIERNPGFRQAVDEVYPPEYRAQLARLRNAYRGAKGKRAQRRLDEMLSELERGGMGGNGSIPTTARENVAASILRVADQVGPEKLPPWARDLLPALREREAMRARSSEGDVFAPAASEIARQPALGYLGYSSRRGRDVLFRPLSTRGAKPKPSPELAGSLKQSTGRAQRTAAYEHDTSRVASTGMAAMNRLHLAVRTNQRLFSAGVKARPADTIRTKFVPVRDRDLSPGAMSTLRALSDKVEHNEPLTGAEREAYQAALRETEPQIDAEALQSPVGTEIEGVRWVPRRVFDRIAQTGAPSSVPTHFTGKLIQSTWREFNSGLRALVLYSKGAGTAYITPNLGANILLGAFQGGPKWVKAAVKSLNPKFRKAVGEDAWNAGRARMGEGFMTSTFAEQAGRGPLSAVAQHWAKMLGKVTDEQTRMASLVYEAGERGFKSPQQFRDLMLDPKHADEAMDATIRARDAALDYGLMTPAERSHVASWLFVYPFIRAASRYTVNFPLDHPYQAAVYAQLAQIASQDTTLGERGLGPDAGLVKVGERNVPGVGTIPVVRNVNSLSPFSALPDTALTVGSFLGLPGAAGLTGRGLLDISSPAITAAAETLAGTDSFTGRPIPRNLKGFGEQVLSSIPVVQNARQLQKTPEQLAKQTSPRQPRDVLEQQITGSLAAHPYNVVKAQEYRARDKLAAMPVGQRARVRVFRERQTIFTTMKEKDPQLLVGGRLPVPVRQAYNRKAEIESARAVAQKKSGGNSVAYYRDVAYREARLYERWGAAPKGFAADVKRQTATASLDVLKSGVRKMRDDLAPNLYRDITSEGAKYLERRSQ